MATPVPASALTDLELFIVFSDKLHVTGIPTDAGRRRFLSLLREY
jgi:hypothetical protein